MEDFGLTSLFENAAAPVPLPKVARRESLRCRGFDRGRRCRNMIQYHDHVCHEHVDYYRHWWAKNMEKFVCTEGIVRGSDFTEYQKQHMAEFDFQLGGGYVDFADPYFEMAMREMELIIQERLADNLLLEKSDRAPIQNLWFLHNLWIPYFYYLCRFPAFEANKWPAFIKMIFQHRVYVWTALDDTQKEEIRDPYAQLLVNPHIRYADLLKVHIQVLASVYGKTLTYSQYDRTLIGHDYVEFVSRHMEELRWAFCCYADQAYALFDKLLPAHDIMRAGLRSQLRFVSAHFKRRIYRHTNRFKEELMATTWAPERLPFWNMDEGEIAETFEGGRRPCASEWQIVCKEAWNSANSLMCA